MCPAGSPAGAEPAPERLSAVAVEPAAWFSPAAACDILGLQAGELERWERASAALRLAEALTFADPLALAVLAEAARRLGDGVGAFGLGLRRLFTTLAERDDLERLDDHVALVGRDFAQLARLKADHVRCPDGGFIVVPLGPILADLRDRAFS
jgi:hypothetical protein